MTTTPLKVHYVSGSRADFGLMNLCLKALDRLPEFDVELIITGQHLIEKYGTTESDIRKAGLTIGARIKVQLSGGTGAEMGFALAQQMQGFLTTWQQNRPDLVLVLGDRGEMLAATLAAIHLGLHVGHLHGGELSGTIDESFRHAISKLAHFHFTTSEDASDRLRRMGEKQDSIWNVGAPGLVGILEQSQSQIDIYNDIMKLDWVGPKVMMCFHPVVQEADFAAEQVETILQLLDAEGAFGIILKPNSDAGGAEIDAALDRFKAVVPLNRFVILDHLDRKMYLQSLAQADLLLGNSSSGIIESASLGLPCLNIGTRQNGRLRNSNIVDCPIVSASDLAMAFQAALKLKGPFENKFGDGKTDQRLLELLPTLQLTKTVLNKENCY